MPISLRAVRFLGEKDDREGHVRPAFPRDVPPHEVQQLLGKDRVLLEVVDADGPLSASPYRRESDLPQLAHFTLPGLRAKPVVVAGREHARDALSSASCTTSSASVRLPERRRARL